MPWNDRLHFSTLFSENVRMSLKTGCTVTTNILLNRVALIVSITRCRSIARKKGTFCYEQVTVGFSTAGHSVPTLMLYSSKGNVFLFMQIPYFSAIMWGTTTSVVVPSIKLCFSIVDVF